MSSIKLPIVSASLGMGEAAKLANKGGVGAFLVHHGGELSLVKVRHLPAMPDAEHTVDTIVGRLGRPVRAIGGAPTGSFASVEIDDTEHAAINAPIGYMQCTKNKDHTYPTSVQGNCPKHDGGQLELVFF